MSDCETEYAAGRGPHPSQVEMAPLTRSRSPLPGVSTQRAAEENYGPLNCAGPVPTDEDSHAGRAYIRQLEADRALQSAQIATLIGLLTQRTEEDRKQLVDVKLTHFDVDDSPYSMKEWLDIANRSKVRHGIPDDDMIMKVGDALRKRALHYFRHWKPLERTWEKLVDDLASAFPVSTTYYLTFVAIATERSREFDTLATFCHNKLRLLQSFPGIRFEWEMIMSVIEGCLDNEEARTRIKQIRPENETELITIMGQMDNEKRLKARTARNSSEATPRAQHPRTGGSKASFLGKCFKCLRLGHKSHQCYARGTPYERPIERRPTDQRPTTNADAGTCTHCKRRGHTEDKCYFKHGFPAKTTDKAIIKKALMLKSNRRFNTTPIATAISKNKQEFLYLLDTGADVSLMHEHVAKQLETPIQQTTRQIQGLGTGVTHAKGSCTALVKLPQVLLEIEFLVVKDGTIPEVDALIGWDVIGQEGLQLVKTSKGMDLRYEQTPVAVRAVKEILWSGMDERIEIQVKQLIETTKQLTPSHVTTGELHITLKDFTPVAYRPRPLAYSERQKLKEIIEQQLLAGIIQPSNSEYASPIVLVKKKNGDLRLCVDYRDLNRRVVKDRYPLPRIQDQIDALSQATYYTTLDMEAGFHQLLVEPSSRHLLAFITPDGHYEYSRMPFGFVNSPSCYQRAMDKALGNLKDKIAFVYLDDILIPSRTKEEGYQRLKLVLTTLATNGFKLNLEKCNFFDTKTEYLGVIIEAGTQQPSPRKVEALKNTSPPTDVKGVRQLMGLAGYFRKFIAGFSMKAAPITALLKKDARFDWTDECERVRRDIIDILTQAPVLKIYDPLAEIELHTDASSIGIGGILMQVDEHTKTTRPVAYYSRRTTPSEAKYHSYDLETLAIVEATQHFRVYLYGKQFTIYTDCNSVRATALKKELHPRVARWWMKLQDFTFNIEYRPGEKMAHVDYLSRNPVTTALLVTEISPEEGKNMTLKQWQQNDKFCNEIKSEENTPEGYSIRDDVIYFQDKCYVPIQARLITMRKYHNESSHPGPDKMIAAMRKDLFWKGMTKSVRKYTQNCKACITGKSHTGKRSGMCQQKEKATEKLDTWHIDHAGPLVKSNGKTQILVVIDAFTKFVKFCAINQKTSAYTIKALKEIFTEIGKPKRIIADRALAFTSTSFKDFMTKENIELHLIATGMPRGNGQVERMMRTLFNMLRATLTDKNEKNWTKELLRVEHDINRLESSTTGTTPVLLMTGENERLRAVREFLKDLPNEKEDEANMRQRIIERMKRKQEQMKERFNKPRKEIIQKFKTGDQVVIEKTQIGGGKIGPRYDGPFEIMTILENDRYALRRMNGQRRIAVAGHEQLRLWPAENEKRKH